MSTRTRRSYRAYNSWAHMKQRCNNPNCQDYHHYGGRGISYDPRWEHFENFLADMGERPKWWTLERIDNEADYGPDNCRWATQAEQIRNTRRNINVTLKGETHCLKDWCTRLNLNYITILYRVQYYGWEAERALTTPIRPMKRRS